MANNVLTTSNGAPVGDNQNSLTAGNHGGPILLQDFTLIDKLAHFDRERIPERVVHAHGSGAHGYFEVTHDVTKYTKAAFLNKVGKKTPMFIRFSTVAGEKGSADTARDPRGFAVKFYTEEGNYDLVGNNTPIFFIRDPSKFPDFIHSQKRDPKKNVQTSDSFWDFVSLSHETCHQILFLMSPRGTPYGFRHMHGYGSHTFKWVNAEGKAHWVKYHFRTDQGIKNFTAEEADAMKAKDLDFAQRDLYDNIEKGNYPSWTLYVQIIPYEEGLNYRYNIFDVTKVVPFSDYPLIPVGKMVLNRNPENYFAEVEQAAFSPSHLVPGIEASPDRMLQGRLFSYPDTHRHRLGVNYQQLPINCPYAARVRNYYRDGFMAGGNNGGSGPNYEPNSFDGPREAPKTVEARFDVGATVGRYDFNHPNDDYEQPRIFYTRVLSESDREQLINNIVNHMNGVSPQRKDIKVRACQMWYLVHPELGMRVARGVGVDVSLINKGNI